MRFHRDSGISRSRHDTIIEYAGWLAIFFTSGFQASSIIRLHDIVYCEGRGKFAVKSRATLPASRHAL